MKKIAFILFGFALLIACQKTISKNIDNGTAEPQGGITDSTGNGGDSSAVNAIISAGDVITYEVITKDSGWFGVWNDSTGILRSNALDSNSYGGPIYFPSGWKYSFTCPDKPFQALLSVAAKSYSQDITANLYKNGKLIKSITNDEMKGVAKFLVNTNTDSIKGTTAEPVLTYEVLVNNADTSKYESNSWNGDWTEADGIINSINAPCLLGFIAMPSGWKYSFKPNHLPFIMHVQAWPYTPDGGTVTINYYVNEELVKTISSQDYIYDFTYQVQ